jgi:outer membrane protein TolC
MPPLVLAAFAGLVATVPLSGCSNLSGVDRSIQRLIQERTSALGDDAAAPDYTFRDPRDVEAQAAAFEERPPTTNPNAGELQFDPRSPADAETRLRRLDEYLDIPQQARVVTLPEALRISQDSAREYISAEEEYILDAIRLLIERHLWGPRFFDDIEARLTGFNLDDQGGEYRIEGEIINTLRVTQRLPYGGNVEARLVSQLTDELRNAATEDYESSSDIVLTADLPLLRGAGIVAREDLIQAERNVVYAARRFERFRREFFVDIASDYFDLLLQRENINNQVERLESVRREQNRIRELFEAGRRSAFEVNNFRQNVLRSEDNVLAAKETYRVALDRFKNRIGVPLDQEIELAPVELTLPEPDVTPTKAALLALDYRLDLQNRRDQIDDARRSVNVAKNNLLPDFDLSGSANIPTQSDRRLGGANFRTDEGDYTVAARFSLPLDRQIERLNLRSATITLERAIRELDNFINGIIIDSRQAVRDIERAQFSILQQEEAIRINELRLEETRLKIDTVDPQSLLDAQNELLLSRNDRDRAIRDYRVAILQYLLVTGQMRVTGEGNLQPLQGMVVIEGEATPRLPGRDPGAVEGDDGQPQNADEAGGGPPPMPRDADEDPEAPGAGRPENDG